MDIIANALETSYLRASAEESAAWEALRVARERLVEQAIAAGVGASAARNWIGAVEAKPRIEPRDRKANEAVERLSRVASAEIVGDWLQAARHFGDATDRAYRAASELSDRAGVGRRHSVEGRTEMGEIKQELLAIATRLNPTLELRFSRELYGEGAALVASGAAGTDRMAVAGMYEPFYHLATISLNRRFNPKDTAYHEAFHSIERVLTEKERAVLVHAFPPRGGLTSEERTAIAFADWAQRRERLEDTVGVDDRRTVRNAFRRLALMGGRTRQALLGHGFEKAEAVFERVYGGEMGGRSVEQARSAARQRGTRRAASVGAAYSIGRAMLPWQPSPAIRHDALALPVDGGGRETLHFRNAVAVEHVAPPAGGMYQLWRGYAVRGDAVASTPTVFATYQPPGTATRYVLVGPSYLSPRDIAEARHAADRQVARSVIETVASAAVQALPATAVALAAGAAIAGTVFSTGGTAEPLRLDPAQPRAERDTVVRRIPSDELVARYRTTAEALARAKAAIGGGDRSPDAARASLELKTGRDALRQELERRDIPVPASERSTPERPQPRRSSGVER